ncbi:hypothetical protein ACK3BK_13890 [Pseudomonas sp. L7]|uniref:hypothetical protein n=1 Tax=Pseudomonas sp. L7 TaxID=3388343 RepID=UPI0039846CC3
MGLNYTYFYDEHLDNGAKLELSDSWGAAVHLQPQPRLPFVKEPINERKPFAAA